MDDDRLPHAQCPNPVTIMHALGLIVEQIAAGGGIATIGDPLASRAWAIVLGIVFAIIAISLLVASWTRWGQTKPLAKCVGIAVLAHIWLLMYAYGTRIVSPGIGPGSDGGIHQSTDPPATFAWEGLNSDAIPSISASDDPLPPSPDADPALRERSELSAQPWEIASASNTSELIDAPKLPDQILGGADRSDSDNKYLEGLMHIPDSRSDNDLLSMAELPIDPTLPRPPSEMSAPPPVSITADPKSATSANIPAMYRMRMSPDRAQYAANLGGDALTETAVRNALVWLSRAQSQDGSWNAEQHGAGSDPRGSAAQPEGQYRAHAGRRADTAMTGLALLAFLGAGHTHRDGPYAITVRGGLQYLLSQQFPSGDLSGRMQVGQDPTVRYARMYSHGMAGLAIAEAYAMTSDPALLLPLQSAANYSLQAMNPRTGGWRYDFASDDPGDTSQFGWQAMLLHSASKSRAIAIPGPMRLGLQRFLDSVSTGRYGGLAVYRNTSQGMRPTAAAATPAMTAEAMAMRCLLELPITADAAREAQEMILANLPNHSQENFYYWYYAALTMFQLRNQQPAVFGTNIASPSESAWQQWNEAMKQQLCASQTVHGADAGSWNPNCVWGAYGGRVYSTAVACMCLEVYYRYLPMYCEVASEFSTATKPR